MSGTDRGHAPATLRNRDPILSVLRDVLPPSGTVLELASGTGEHVSYFAARLPGLTFQPSDRDPDARRSVDAWVREAALDNLRPVLAIDAQQRGWEQAIPEPPVAILNINMIHISPWSACQGLMRGAGRLLGAGAPLFLYGPYRREGRHTAPSNEAFDESLRQRDARWGVRDLERVVDCAGEHGLRLDRVVEMPANNLSVVLRRSD